ncbi:MAG: hypothetical protein J6V44_10500 [Methanobrevibacter sp.]|nr:hypothetical protein [Methanobrevibacter sp.]
MLSLQNILNTEGREFLENLLNKEVIVTEKLNAATLSMQKKQTSEMDLNRNLTFYKGTGVNKKEITIADRVMTTFYLSGMTYLSNLSKLIIDRIPANWTFVFKYFPNHQPSFINYSVLPKNNLVLCCIITSGGTKIDDCEDLKSWAEMFDVPYQEPIFKGYLSEYQKEKLRDYVEDGSNNKESFARFIITLLNPSLKGSLYQNDGFESPIDGFVFKFISDDGVTKPMTAKLIDPFMSALISKNKSKKGYNDNTDVLLSDFTIFMSNQDMDSIVLTKKDDGERYLELFYRLFNRYIKYKKSQLEDFDVDTNDIVKESIDVDFGVDIDKISNETTKKLLKDNPEFKSIFKTLLGSFKSKKDDNYKSIVMSPGVVRLFNDIVDKINSKTSSCEETDNLSFASYLNTIHKNDIQNLDVNNAPDNVEKPQPIPDALTQQKNIEALALSFSDFQKKSEKEEKKEEDGIKSIEDMIKSLKGEIKDLTKEVSDLKKDQKEVKKNVEDVDDATKDIAKDVENIDSGSESESDEDKKNDSKKEEKSETSDKDEEKKSDEEDENTDSEESTDDETNEDDATEEEPDDKKESNDDGGDDAENDIFAGL